MGRSSLPVGAWGTVSAKKDAASGKWRASCRFRGYDGVARPYSKFGSTKDKAKNALLVSMMQRQQEKGRLAENPSLKDVGEKWLSSIEVPHVVRPESNLLQTAATPTKRNHNHDHRKLDLPGHQ